MESSVDLVSLQGLPLVKRETLASAIRSNMSRYEQVLDVKVCTDEFNLLTGKDSVLLDTSPANQVTSFAPLEHEVHMETNGHKRIVLARWRGMAVHCNYCKKEGHKIAECAKLQASKERQQRKLCYICDSPDHLKANCPRSQQAQSTGKRARTEDVLHDPRTPRVEEDSHSDQTSQHTTVTNMDVTHDVDSAPVPEITSGQSYSSRSKAKAVDDQDTLMNDSQLDDSLTKDSQDVAHQEGSQLHKDHDMDDGGSSSSTSPHRL
ncbi:predicted protein [Lichtheimia corymbifera JMRC:FSU:9682]|uniref:CCHC-type domain-containing protein n=1 Tax=Lichtheimia corymbifera JMRC:FSU:9682 TaxID=1263082 RepID=A0A068SER6_9FUNG|nr:predicted protein [Lichtheimia corymbifera JMRC:FSU:9682]